MRIQNKKNSPATKTTFKLIRFACCLAVALIAMSYGSQSIVNAQTLELEVREGTGVPEEVRTIYDKGINFLVRSQRDNGSFGKAGAVSDPNEAAGTTSLCLMALLSTGEDPNYGRYAGNIRKGLRFVIRSQNPKSGYIPGNMYVHGFSMLALSEAYGAINEKLLWAGQEKDKRTRSLGKALELAVRLAVDSQKKNPQKSWRYSPNDRSADTSVNGAVLMGLLAARNAGIPVPDESIDGSLQYMKSMTDSKSGMVGYSGLEGLGDSSARSSIACLVFAISKHKDWEEFEGAKKYVVDNVDQNAGTWPFYLRYYRAQALFQADFETWEKWNKRIIEKIKESQADDGQIGSSQHGSAYSTSMSLLALALNYRFLPIYER